MNKKTRISIAGAGAVVIALGVFYSVYPMQPTAAADVLCQSKDEAMEVTRGKLAMKEPTYLPAGYQFLCADGNPEYVILYFGPSDAVKGEPTRNELISNGAILVGAKRFDREADEVYDIRDRKSDIENAFAGLDPRIETRLTEISGNLAAVREMCEDCGKGVVTYEDGHSEETSTFPIPTVIEFYDGDVKYRLEAYLPSNELEMVAQSLA